MARKPKTDQKPKRATRKPATRKPKDQLGVAVSHESEREKMLGAVRGMAMLGGTMVQMAKAIGVRFEKLKAMMSEDPELCAAIEEGKSHADDIVEQSLFNRAKGYTRNAVKVFNDEGRPMIVRYEEDVMPDVVACIFWLKNRRPRLWRDRQELNVTGEGLAAMLEKRRERANCATKPS